MRNLLRAALAGDGAHASESRRLELDTLIQKGSQLRISTMHVLVEPIHAPEAEKWVATAMTSAYEGELLIQRKQKTPC